MLSVTFGILAGCCLLYFGVIALYSGLETSAIWIWLVLALVFFLLSRGFCFYQKNREKVPLWLPVSVITLLITGVVIFLILQGLIFGGMMRPAPAYLDYLIVLGARVREDEISLALKSRLDKAIRFLEEHPETTLVLSGGQGEGEPCTEAMAMAEYLRYNGVEPERMLLETYSTNTTENMICSKALIDDQRRKAREEEERRQIHRNKQRMEMDRFLMELEPLRVRSWPGAGPGLGTSRLPEEQNQGLPSGESEEILPDKPLQIGVLTSNFHLYRALQIGKKNGFDQLYGVAASSDPVLFVHYCVRESLAILKDKFMGNM